MEVLLNDTLRLYVSWSSFTVQTCPPPLPPQQWRPVLALQLHWNLVINEGPSDCKNMFVVTGFRYIEVLFRLEPKGFPIFTITAKAKKTRPTPYQPRHESKGLHNLMKVSLNNLPLNNLIHWRLHQQLHHNRSCCWELELRHQIQPSLWLSLLTWSVDCPCCC